MEHFREEPRTARSFEPPLVTVVVRHDGTGLTLEVHGEAAHCTAALLLADLLRALRPGVLRVSVDLTDLWFCDVGGANALHAFVAEAGSRGIHVTLHGMSALLTLVYSTFSAPPARLPRDVLVGPGPAALN